MKLYQLRYPNSHTHYFSCCLLYLFAEANTEAIQEQITRVLLERLIVNRPHPWGLLITFIELIKNPTFKFWAHEFVHCAPEIQKLFESVARSCIVASQPRQDSKMCSGEESYARNEWWHYCATGKRHPGVTCIDYWVLQKRNKYMYHKYLESEVDAAADKDKYQYPLDKERKCKESMMDEYEERRIAWAKFSKKQCFKHSKGK